MSWFLITNNFLVFLKYLHVGTAVGYVTASFAQSNNSTDIFLCGFCNSANKKLSFRLKKKENEKDDEKEVKEEDRETREKRCFICGDVGHVRRDCPEFKQTRQRNSSVPGMESFCS